MPQRVCPEKYFTPGTRSEGAQIVTAGGGYSAQSVWATPSPPRKLRRTSSCHAIHWNLVQYRRDIGLSRHRATNKNSSIAACYRWTAGGSPSLPCLARRRAPRASSRFSASVFISSAFRQPQSLCFRNWLARGPHPRQARPDRALLAHLVRLEFIEVAEAHLPRFDDDGAGRNRRTVEFETALRAHDDAV